MRNHRRANRKRANERMNYGDVYTVHSDGSIAVESIGDLEWVSVTVYEEELNNDYMYDWDAIEAELYEGVVSSIGGAEPVEAVPGYFISSMSGVDVDALADLGPGEYRLCPVSLSYWVDEGEFGDLEHDDGFDYDVVVRY